MRNKRIAITAAIIITVLLILIITINPLHHVEFACYDKDEGSVFFKSNDTLILEHVISPVWGEKYILAIYYDGKDEFIGKYVIEEGVWENLMPVSLFCEEMGGQIEASQFSNFRLVGDRKLTFICQDGIYEYDMIEKEIHLIKLCDGVSKFEWMDQDTLIILDKTSSLFIGWLKEYDIYTKEEVLVDKSVTDFVYQGDSQIVYAKKYFLGSWCEYELKYVDAHDLKLIKNKRYINTSIGQIVQDSDHNIFVVESRLSLDNELDVKKIFEGSLNAIYVGKIPSSCYCIGIK